MRIAIINQPQDPILAAAEQRGSVAIVNWELAQCLAARHEVTVLAPQRPGQGPRESWGGIAIERVPFAGARLHKGLQVAAGHLGRSPWSNSRLYCRGYFEAVAAVLRRLRPEVVHLPVQLQFAAALRAAAGGRLVLHMHQDELAQLDPACARRQLAAVDAVVTVSQFLTRRALERLPADTVRIETIGNGVDLRRFRPAPPRTGAPDRLLFVGRLSPDKGVHLLVAAFTRIADRFPDVELTLVGRPGLMPWGLLSLLLQDDPAAMAELRRFYGNSAGARLVRELASQHTSYPAQLRRLVPARLRRRIHFRQELTLDELAAAYRAADLLVLPSVWQESYGLPVAEAMASGVPVLASDCGGVPELVLDGLTGRLVPRMDAGALEHALAGLLARPEALRQMGLAGRRRAEERLGWQASAARLEQVYASLAAADVRRNPGADPVRAATADGLQRAGGLAGRG